jgi:hypothetical protein
MGKRVDKLQQALLWAEIMSSSKTPWYRPWHRGYVQALKDIQYFLRDDCSVVIMPIEEYKAIEGDIKSLLEEMENNERNAD